MRMLEAGVCQWAVFLSSFSPSPRCPIHLHCTPMSDFPPTPGTTVFAKLKGFPWWPARVRIFFMSLAPCPRLALLLLLLLLAALVSIYTAQQFHTVIRHPFSPFFFLPSSSHPRCQTHSNLWNRALMQLGLILSMVEEGRALRQTEDGNGRWRTPLKRAWPIH